MIRLCGICILLILSTNARAQYINVNVVAKNESNEIIQNATAQILNVKDSTVITAKALKNNPTFLLNTNSTFLLKITAVGIVPSFLIFTTANNDTLITATVKTFTKKLDAVVVTTTKPLIKQEDDKTIIDAEPLAISSTNALEILEKTPGAIVDQDGNVYLNSATPATILINGRELKLSAADIASLLKSLPANTISKIETISNPSAKFDAASSGGVVNIVLKKGSKLGLNGTVDVSHFQGVYATETAGFNFNNSKDKLNTYFSYTYTDRTFFQYLDSERPYFNTVFVQDLYIKYKSTGNSVGGGMDYKINNKWNINIDSRFNANNNSNHTNNAINILQRNSRSIKIGENLSVVDNEGPTYFLGNTVAAKYKIDSLGSEWNNSIDYSYYKTNNTQSYDNFTFLPTNKLLLGDGDIKNNKNLFAFKSDVVIKTKAKYTIEAGAKFNYSLSNNRANFLVDTGLGKYQNNFQTNTFKFKETIAAGYFQISKTYKGITFKPGVRVEHTDIVGNQIIPAPTTKFVIKRTDVFPYLFLRRNITKVMGFKLIGNLIYRKSILRPFYENLNPFPRYADQYTFDVGDPTLKPQITNNYEFSVSANEFPVFSVGVNDIQDIITTLTYSRGDTLFRTVDNLGKNKETYMRLVAGIPPGKKYFFYLGTIINAINYNGIFNGEQFAYRRTSWNIFTFHSYKATPNFTLSMNGWLRLNGVFNFFEYKRLGTLNFTANKTTKNKKINIIFTLNDILKTNRINFAIDVPKFEGSGFQYADVRRFGIGLKYNFGLKPRVEKKQGFDIPAEAN